MDMFSTIITVLSAALICGGLTFFLGAAVGLVRFPDFYTRMHAAGKGDTLSTMMILAGVALYQFHDLPEVVADAAAAVDLTTQIQMVFSHFKIELLVAIKIMTIAAFIMLTSPTSTHALMEAGYDDGIEPFSRDNEPSDDKGMKETKE